MGMGEFSGKPDEMLGGLPCNGLVSHPVIILHNNNNANNAGRVTLQWSSVPSSKILQEYKWVLVNCQGSLMKCWEGNLAMDLCPIQ